MLQEQNGSQNLQKKKEEKVQSRELIGIGLILSIYDRREYIYICTHAYIQRQTSACTQRSKGSALNIAVLVSLVSSIWLFLVMFNPKATS